MQTFWTHHLQVSFRRPWATQDSNWSTTGRSWETQRITTFQDIAESYDKKCSQIDITVSDFSEAFDTAPHDGLLSKLKLYA